MLVRQRFGPEGAAYVRSYFDSNARFGKRLGRLLGRRDIEAGTISACVPAESSLDQRLSFQAGGLFSRRPHTESDAPGEAEACVTELFTPAAASPPLVCVEDAFMRRTDEVATQLTDVDVFFCGDAAYWYTTDNAPAESVLQRLPLSGSIADPNIGIVTTLPAELTSLANGNSIPSAALEKMATAAVAVLIGAWDHEGLLVWKPPKSRGHWDAARRVPAATA